MRGAWNRGGGALLLAASLLVAPGALATETSQPLKSMTCSLPAMLEELRAALKTGSPTYRKYLRALLKEAALGLPVAELRAAIDQERDPEVLEALGAALAAKSSNAQDPRLLRPLLLRATREADPTLRAAAVRGLRGIGSVESMSKSSELTYAHLIRDPAPEVREAVASNLVQESANIYFGHDRAVSEMAVEAAAASQDPAVAAKLLSEVSMEQIGKDAVEKVTRQLRSDSPALRAAAATALGGVPGAHAQGTQQTLLETYRSERDPTVRKAILEAIARLGFSRSLPTLESLRSVDPSLGPEIDAWTAALKLNLQEWEFIKREKLRFQKR